MPNLNLRKEYDKMRQRDELYPTSVRLSKTDIENIENYAANKNTSKTDAMRKLIRKGLKFQELTDVESDLSRLIRQNLDCVLKPHVNRLASLSAKACLSGGTSKYLLTEVLDILHEVDGYHLNVEDLYDEARHKAYQDLKVGFQEE
jgi:hypothetical protein